MTDQEVSLEDPNLANAWKALTDEKTPTNWIAFSIREGDNAMELFDHGEGGFLELKQKMKMNWASKVVFGAFSVVAMDRRGSTTSRRSKFVCFSYVGGSVPDIQKARAGFQKSNLLPKLFPSTHLTLEINPKNLSDTTEITIAKRLHDATAAHKPTHYQFGANAKEISVEEIMKGDESSGSEFED